MAEHTEAERHFPTYTLGKETIAIKEYEFSAQLAANEERLFANTSTIIALFAGLFASLTWGGLNRLYAGIPDVDTRLTASTAVITISLALAYIAFSHLGNVRRSYVYAARKVIILRRMLGQSYGSTSLILPAWRIEGADEPYAIRMFPGWRVRYLFPQYVITAVTCLILFTAIYVGFPSYITILSSITLSKSAAYFFILIPAIAALLVATRRSMLDDNETQGLFIARLFASVLNVPLTRKYEYHLYRARLARAELHRIGIDLTNLREIAVFREDRTFFSHQGVALRSTMRAGRDYLLRKSSGGASSIPQQLARSLFITDLRGKLRRKAIEILLALWLSERLTKDELLEVYLASVRFERSVVGVAAAMRHFFGKIVLQPTKGQCFVLIERLANTRSLFRGRSVAASLSSALSAGILTVKEADEVIAIYEDLIGKGLISLEDGGLSPRQIAGGHGYGG